MYRPHLPDFSCHFRSSHDLAYHMTRRAKFNFSLHPHSQRHRLHGHGFAKFDFPMLYSLGHSVRLLITI